MPTNMPKKKRSVPMKQANRKRLARQISLSNPFQEHKNEKRYPAHLRLISLEEAREEVINRYKIPGGGWRAREDEEDETSLTELKRAETEETVAESFDESYEDSFSGVDNEDLAGLAFLDE